ncbi:hypothetical protein SETIT_4G187000v2 [Setaria italica]|uniref:SKP1 component dimerisation domain-containing protein n=1 Tax=Setaria italica TaxID=4555 RepID=A0A368QVN5_SETIT|nr:hypothetical protein SETIT_4G187000v2 [Setaria italica]
MAEESGAAMITLISFDNTRFETMRRLIEEGGGRAGVHNGIPLPQVDATTLAKRWWWTWTSSDYLHVRGLLELTGKATADLIRVKPLEEVMGLMELACRAINDLVRDRPVEEVRWVLGIIDNGFTVEEEEEIRRENAWAFE